MLPPYNFDFSEFNFKSFWYDFIDSKSRRVPIQIEEPERFPRAVLPALCKYSSGFSGKSMLII